MKPDISLEPIASVRAAILPFCLVIAKLYLLIPSLALETFQETCFGVIIELGAVNDANPARLPCWLSREE
jgi:hypothetical protein